MQPLTSQLSKQASKELAVIHKQKILIALKSIGKGSFEDIAKATGLTPHQVARRLKELEGDKLKWMPELIVKLDETKPTVTGRKAYLYQLNTKL
jgi:predicted ArsR family transcriptional regulator